MNDEPGSSSIAIEVCTLDPLWLESLPACVKVAKRAAAAALDHSEGSPAVAPQGELSLVLASDLQVQALNRDYREQDKPTNVLSFPNMDGDSPQSATRLLGDVVLARETVSREAAQQSKTLSDHLSHLVVHGVLHLLGYDHLEDRDAASMESCEIRILATLDVQNPYGDARSDLGGLDR